MGFRPAAVYLLFHGELEFDNDFRTFDRARFVDHATELIGECVAPVADFVPHFCRQPQLLGDDGYRQRNGVVGNEVPCLPALYVVEQAP